MEFIGHHQGKKMYHHQKREEREMGVESLFKEINKNVLNLKRDLDTEVHETSRSPKNFNPKQSSPRQIMTKLSYIKDT